MTESDEQRSTADVDAGEARSRWTPGRIVATVFSSIGGLIGLALLLGGIAILLAYAFGRDDDGYFTTDRTQLESATFAISTEDIDLGRDELDWAPDRLLGTLRLQVDSKGPVFVGIGRDGDVDRYLSDVAHDELIGFDGNQPVFDLLQGGAPSTAPGKQDFWAARSQGLGEQTLTWDAEFGRWTAVVMNDDAGRGIDVSADVGVKLDWAIWVGLGLFVVGLLMTVGATVAILLISQSASRDPVAG